MYALGTLKVAWVEKDVEYLSSLMFEPNQLDQAVAYGEKVGDYMIMQLIEQKGDFYRWRVLPYGNDKQYLRAMRWRRTFDNLFNQEENSFYTAPNGSVYTSKESYQTQMVRLAYVFLIGPFLIYVSTLNVLPKHIRRILFLIGIATIVYNGNRYIKEIK